MRMIQFRASADEIRVMIEALKGYAPLGQPEDAVTAENMADYLETEMRESL